MWWEEGWQATPLPAPPTVPKLIPIVSTAETIDAVELAEIYTRRWPLQENIIRDFLLPLGLDTNHGYSKRPVENVISSISWRVCIRKLAHDRLEKRVEAIF